MSRPKFRQLLLIGATALAAAAALVMLYLLTQVDDWNRDLTENSAQTFPADDDFGLRPIYSGAKVSRVVMAVDRAVEQLPHWTLVDRKVRGDAARYEFTVVSPWLRWRDDVTIEVTKTDLGCEVTGQSRSRTSLGDLGRNPRHLREILNLVREDLFGGDG